MKTKFLLISIILHVIMIGCKSKNDPEQVTTKVNAKFSFRTEAPMKVIFTNTSTDAETFEWDFGDNTTSTDKNPTHRYAAIGVYRVKLTAKCGQQVHEYESNIIIEAPSKCFIVGVSISKIPTNNSYYQLQLTDDYILSKTTYFYTDWYLLSSANLPYNIKFREERQITIANDYVLRLYKNSNKQTGQASGKGNLSWNISSKSLQTYPETIACSASTATVEVLLHWQ